MANTVARDIFIERIDALTTFLESQLPPMTWYGKAHHLFWRIYYRCHFWVKFRFWRLKDWLNALAKST
jgi:hypothetical protein